MAYLTVVWLDLISLPCGRAPFYGYQDLPFLFLFSYKADTDTGPKFLGSEFDS